MYNILTRGKRSGGLLLALLSLAVALALLFGTARARPENNPGQPFAQLEAKLDDIQTRIGAASQIEAKLDAIEAKLDTQCPIPPDGTSVDLKGSSDPGFRAVAEATCASGPCTCLLNGFQAPCSLVLACLDAGLCEQDGN